MIEEHIVQFLTHLLQTIGWPGVLVIMIVESCNIPIPSEVTMPLAGWMLAEALGRSPAFAIVCGALIGATGCTLGSILSYGLGAWGGRPLIQRYGHWILVYEEDLQQADRWFGRWGDWAAFVSRLLPVVRTFISLPSGIVRMNFVRFVAFTFTGSLIWCGLLSYGGFVLGSNWLALRTAMRPFDLPIAIVIVVAVAYYLYHHIQRGRRRVARATD